MADDPQLIAALRAAHAAGKTEDARRIAAIIERESQQAEKPRTLGNYIGMGTRAISKGVGDIVSMADSLAVVPNLINSAMGRPSFGQAMAGVIDRSSDRRGLSAPRTNAERLGSEAVRGVVASAPLLMAGGPVAAQPIRQLLSGGAGYASGEAARQQGAGPVLQTLASLAGGLATYGGASALANLRLGPKAAGAAPRPPASTAGAPRINTNPVAPLGRKAVVRDATMRRAGVQNPTTGMVTRDPRMWNFEQETAKLNGVGDDMQSALIGVEDDLRRSARGIVDRQGGAIGQEAMGKRANSVLADKSQALQDEVGALYTQVREQSGNARIPDLKNTRALSDHPIFADNDVFDGMVAQLNKRLQRYADADRGAAGLSVNQAEEARKFVGRLGGQDPESKLMRRTIQEALDADVLDNFGGAPFANARAAAKARFAEFEQTLPGKVAAGDIPGERLSSRIMSQSTSLDDVRELRKSLTGGPTAARGKEALDSIGAEVMDEMLKKHIPSEGVIKGGSLFKEFQQNAPRLQIILGPERYREMRRLALAARYATADVPKSNINYSGSASNFANILGPEVTQKATSNLLPNLARRVAGTAVGSLGGITGALAGDAAANTANQALAARAARTAGARVAEQVRVARDPAAAARLIEEATSHADPVVSNFAKTLAGSMRPVAAIGAAANNNGLFFEQVPRRLSAGEAPEDQRR